MCLPSLAGILSIVWGCSGTNKLFHSIHEHIHDGGCIVAIDSFVLCTNIDVEPCLMDGLLNS